ncbi:hypothetical protein S2M10_25250 [Sphingomonas sp. S2M10]|uniref:hypothetical protein n=1 Tax=Sphingomonas sp. S2M10 TaxID=2705010 RepID=UPI0014564CB3|nr:hypothetical protein [Sphingomonas sp. S2M10]NLS27529.1 hypothetical protein [Sphingomonas sp. S2M10]
MRETVQLERSGYQATGKHWFALKLIIALFVLGLLSMLPLKDNILHWGYVAVAFHGIFEALRLLVTPHRSHEVADGQSYRTIRVQGALLLIAWAALLLFAIQKLF